MDVLNNRDFNQVIPSLEDIKKKLNPQQSEAVNHKNGPAVVFAGAGSGKTRVITTRIVSLLEEGFRPSEILAVTFTNKAAKEMRQRIEELSPLGHLVHVGTFHSSCARWLREFSSDLGFTSEFTIYDDKDSLQAIKTVLKDLNIENDDNPPREYLKAIGRAKTLALHSNEAEKFSLEYPNIFPPMGAQVYQKYQTYLANSNAMDFSDLLMNMLLLLKQNSRVRTLLQERYQHVLVDEYQDTNMTQFSLLSHILNENKNLFVVGDDDQSIYSWRGANPHNIINFQEHFAGAKEIRLEQNYRSSGNIVKAAQAVISNNKKRAPKMLWTDNDLGDKLYYRLEFDGESESWWVTDHIKDESSRFSFQNIAILYRTNAQSRQIEDILRKQNIPYRIYGSLRFYDRLEIKDILAYCRLLTNSDDSIAFRRALNVPTRGLGNKALEQIEQLSMSKDISMMEAAKEIVKDKVPRLSSKLKEFVDMYQKIKNFSENENISDFIPYLLGAINYKAYVQKKFPDQLQDKMSNLHELATAVSEYEQVSPGASLSQWLKDVSLTETEKEEDGSGGVSLMTLHSAKGLEFKKVYILGLEDGLIPHANSQDSDDDLEEERRLLYVGMTRAKEKLCMLSAKKRRMLNNWVCYSPSRFLKDIPPNYFAQQPTLSSFIESIEENPGSLNTHIRVGSDVSHPTYGKGKVIKIEQDFGLIKAVVDFTDFGLRKINSSQLSPVKKTQKLRYTYDL